MYSANIICLSKGLFEVILFTGGDLSIISGNPEHDLMHELTKLGYPDGEIQFYRDDVPSLYYRSIHNSGKKRIQLGEFFPYLEVLRQTYSPFNN